MMKFNKDKFMKTEIGGSMEECIKAWDAALEGCGKHQEITEEYKRHRKTAQWCQAQWEVYKMMLRQFYGMEYSFTRTDEYFGIVTEDETDWLMKVER